MNKMFKKQFFPRTAPALALVTAGAANAAVDVSAVTTDIGSNVSAVVAIGGAVLLVLVAAAAFKWIRKALS